MTALVNAYHSALHLCPIRLRQLCLTYRSVSLYERLTNVSVLSSTAEPAGEETGWSFRVGGDTRRSVGLAFRWVFGYVQPYRAFSLGLAPAESCPPMLPKRPRSGEDIASSAGARTTGAKLRSYPLAATPSAEANLNNEEE
jgi:hypothetical protein